MSISLDSAQTLAYIVGMKTKPSNAIQHGYYMVTLADGGTEYERNVTASSEQQAASTAVLCAQDEWDGHASVSTRNVTAITYLGLHGDHMAQ